MNKYVLLIVGLTIGFLAANGLAKDKKVRNIHGIYPSHELVERFRLSSGVTTGGRPVRDTERLQAREQLNVPDFYGSLVTITGDNKLVVFWFQDEEGVIRNVILDRPVDDNYLLVPTATRELRQELYR